MFEVSPGIEPGLKDSKSLVIPLHHETNNMKNILVNNPF